MYLILTLLYRNAAQARTENWRRALRSLFYASFDLVRIASPS